MYIKDRFQFAVRVYSDNGQRTSKRGKNSPRFELYFFTIQYNAKQYKFIQDVEKNK